VTVDYVSNAADPVVPKADPGYLRGSPPTAWSRRLSGRSAAQPAEIGLAVAHADGVGTNRHDPAGPADPDVPVLVVRAAATRRPLAAMVAYAMHPTVLHEDST
jgi:neutral ceramidase